MSDKEREDPQPDHGKGPKDEHGGRPVSRPVPSHQSGMTMFGQATNVVWRTPVTRIRR